MTASSDSPNDRPAVAIVAAGLAPYRITLLNRLVMLPALRLTALSTEGEWRFQNQAVGLERSRFPYHVFRRYKVSFYSARADQTSLGISPRLWLHLLQNKYDVLVAFAWTSPDSFATLLIAKWRRLPVILWDTSIPHPPGRFKRLLMPFVRRMLGAFDAYFVPGTLSGEYFISMGARAADVTLIPQVIDSVAFGKLAASSRTQAAERRAALGIKTSKVVLFVGQLTARKNKYLADAHIRKWKAHGGHNQAKNGEQVKESK